MSMLSEYAIDFADADDASSGTSPMSVSSERVWDGVDFMSCLALKFFVSDMMKL